MAEFRIISRAMCAKKISEPGRSLKFRCVAGFVLCLALYVFLCLGCAGLQRRMIYFPPRLSEEPVAGLAHKQNMERWISPSGKWIGWKRLSKIQPASGQVMITHGNACGAFQC